MADRRVRYEIDIEARADSVRHASRSTRELHGELRKTKSALGEVARAEALTILGFKGIGIAASEARKGTSEFFEFFGAMAALEVLEKIGEKFFDIGEEAVHSAAKAQRINRVIDNLSGGKEGGERNRKFLEGFASGGKGFTGTEFTEEQSEGAYIDLKKAGMADDRARLAIKAAADIAAVSKDKDMAFQEAVEAFARTKTMGKISARQLLPLGIGVEDFKHLDRYKHSSDKSIRKQMEEGKIGENDLYKLIMSRAGETKLGQRAADNADLLGTKLTKLTELPERFFKKLADTAAVDKLTHAIDTMLEKLDPDSPTGKRIFGALEHAFESFAGAVQGIDWDEMGDTIRNDVLPLVEHMANAIQPAAEAFERAFRAARRLYDLVFGEKAQAIGEVLDSWGMGSHAGVSEADRKQMQADTAAFAEKVAKRRAAMEASGQATHVGANTGNAVTIHKGTMHMVGEAAAQGLADGMRSGKADAAAAAGDVADTMVETVKDKHEIRSPSRVFADIAAMDVAGYVGAMRGLKADVDGAAGAFGVPSRGPLAPGGTMGPPQMNVGPIYIQVDGAGAHDPQQLAGMIRDAFDKNFESLAARWLSRVRAGAGV